MYISFQDVYNAVNVVKTGRDWILFSLAKSVTIFSVEAYSPLYIQRFVDVKVSYPKYYALERDFFYRDCRLYYSLIENLTFESYDTFYYNTKHYLLKSYNKISLPLAFGSNPSKRYQQSGNFKTKEISSDDLVIQEIYTSDGEFFKVELADPLEKYGLPHVDSWNSDPLKFYQNQLNVVTWCSTTRCGVIYEHLSHSNLIISSIFKFHVCY